MPPSRRFPFRSPIGSCLQRLMGRDDERKKPKILSGLKLFNNSTDRIPGSPGYAGGDRKLTYPRAAGGVSNNLRADRRRSALGRRSLSRLLRLKLREKTAEMRRIMGILAGEREESSGKINIMMSEERKEFRCKKRCKSSRVYLGFPTVSGYNRVTVNLLKRDLLYGSLLKSKKRDNRRELDYFPEY